MEISEELKAWRGARYQKEVTDIFGVSLDVYKDWECGRTRPNKITERHIRLCMAANKMGITPADIERSYWSVIKRVATEILNNPKNKIKSSHEN
ncbi:MAG: hypothetical protein KGL39_53420 [Patescibacteria group bacterium]|nr:hypothetical protein [Patescibacteria group bacterium]